jgi:hypothetical protein
VRRGTVGITVRLLSVISVSHDGPDSLKSGVVGEVVGQVLRQAESVERREGLGVWRLGAGGSPIVAPVRRGVGGSGDACDEQGDAGDECPADGAAVHVDHLFFECGGMSSSLVRPRRSHIGSRS